MESLSFRFFEAFHIESDGRIPVFERSILSGTLFMKVRQEVYSDFDPKTQSLLCSLSQTLYSMMEGSHKQLKLNLVATDDVMLKRVRERDITGEDYTEDYLMRINREYWNSALTDPAANIVDTSNKTADEVFIQVKAHLFSFLKIHRPDLGPDWMRMYDDSFKKPKSKAALLTKKK